MSPSKALILIGIGTISLGVVFDVVLLMLGANGYVLALAMVVALSIGGIANYFVVGEFGEDAQDERGRSERTSSARG